MTSAYQKDLRYEKSNYWPIIILPNISKIFENVLCYQTSFLKNFFLNIKLVSGKVSIRKVI